MQYIQKDLKKIVYHAKIFANSCAIRCDTMKIIVQIEDNKKIIETAERASIAFLLSFFDSMKYASKKDLL